MDEWSIATYGDPCRECGYAWSMSLEGTVDLVVALPDEYRNLVRDASGRERHPALDWSVTGYVCHVADNLRIWAERLQGVVRGDTEEVHPYDQDLLASVRGYDAIDLQGALWSLAAASGDWAAAVLEAAAREETGRPARLVHPERGELSLIEVARANCHDAVHHQWDLLRILGSPEA